jgi:hypothetical protein
MIVIVALSYPIPQQGIESENLTPPTELYRSLIGLINTTGCKEKLLNVKIS